MNNTHVVKNCSDINILQSLLIQVMDENGKDWTEFKELIPYAPIIDMPKDKSRVMWEDYMGNKALGTFIQSEDMFLVENGDFTYRMFIKTWQYV